MLVLPAMPRQTRLTYLRSYCTTGPYINKEVVECNIMNGDKSSGRSLSTQEFSEHYDEDINITIPQNIQWIEECKNESSNIERKI